MFCSFDVESTGLYPYQGDMMFAFAIGYIDGKVEVYRLSDNVNYKILKDFFADTSIIKIMHNAKFDLTMVSMENIVIPENTEIHDTMLMSQILRNLAPSHALDYLCWELCGYDRSLDKQVKKLAQELGGYQNVPIHIMNKYQICDAERCQLLFQTFFPSIQEDKKVYADYLNEIELVKTTMRIEKQGINIDRKRCLELIHWMEDELDGVQNDIYEQIGEYINLNSGDQVARLLYTELQMPIIKKTIGNNPSTDKETLAKLRQMHPHIIHDLILKQRSYTKGIAMINSYLNVCDKNDVIHPTINTNKAKTGRESSENPNLQNVSKKAALLNPFPVPARHIFIPPKDHILYLADYSGIEMRLIISEAEQQEMQTIVNDNGDVHALASEVLFGDIFKYEQDIDRKKILRNAGKNANFAIPYGAGAKKIAIALGINQLGISEEQFKDNFKEYQRRWPEIAFFTQNIITRVKEYGFIITAFGRKLNIPKDKLYGGANYLIQSTAAGILKRAQVRVDKYLKDTWNDEIKIIMPIHDELIFAYPIKLLRYKQKFLVDVSNIMIDMPEIKIKLDVEWKATRKTWNDAKGITVKY